MEPLGWIHNYAALGEIFYFVCLLHKRLGAIKSGEYLASERIFLTPKELAYCIEVR
jgi:hypothetical protein